MRNCLLAVLLMFGASAGPVAFAQTSPAERKAEISGLPALSGPVSTSSTKRLLAGERIPVIVMLDVGGDLSAPQSGRRNVPSPTQIAAAREAVLFRAFGVGGIRRTDTGKAAAASDAAARPIVFAEFAVTPGFGILANASEVNRLAKTEGVVRVVEDALARPHLNESTTLIAADLLWADGVEGDGVSVAILDTGVEVEHPMTGPAIIASACYNRNIPNISTSTCPGGVSIVTDLNGASAGDSCVEDDIDSVNGTDGCFHGTHVGSTAAGRVVTTNSRGQISGVSRRSDLVAVNVFSRLEPSECSDDDEEPATEHCVRSYTSDQILALEWLYDNRAALNLAAVNMSLGGGEFDAPCTTDPTRPVIVQLRDAGVATVISSGNEAFTDAVGSPGCIPEAITVGSIQKNGQMSSFSNSSDQVDLLAPGSSIFAAWQSEAPPSGETCYNGSTPNAEGRCNFFATASGTSMAAPHVAGAVALLKGAFPAASVDDIEAALEFTGVGVTDTRNGVTRPRIKLDTAFAFLQNGGAVVSGLSVRPTLPFETSGSQGDPASFGTQVYTLANESGGGLTYTVSTNRDWLLVDNTGGSLAAGAEAQVTVSIDAGAIPPGANNGEITVSVSGGGSLAIPASAFAQPPPPINNDFADAFALSGAETTTRGSNAGADKETGEPDHASAGGASVWWSWTARFGGPVEVNTEGSDFDTMLGVYTGSTISALTVLGTNDDATGLGLRSRVTFTATAGETYHVAVDGWRGDTGQIALNVFPAEAPPNDAFASAEVISGGQGSVAGFLHNATRETGEPVHDDAADGVEGGSIWYSWTAPSTGSFRFRLDGTNTDAAVAVYTGSSVDALTLVRRAVGDGSGIAPTEASPAVDIAAQSGQVYRIAVAADDAPGESRLSWHAVDNTARLLTAILPYARSVAPGEAATAFISVFNDGPVAAENCLLEGPATSDFPAVFTYQTTDPATNALTGAPNTPASIPAGQRQTFVFGLTPHDTVGTQEVSIVARCDNAAAPTALEGVNTFILTSSVTETSPPDLLAIAATVSNDGVVRLPGVSGTQVFTVAAVNIGGDAGDVAIDVEATSAAQVTVQLCETDTSGNCLQPLSGTVSAPFPAGQLRFFSIFVTGNGNPTPFDPARARLFVRLSEQAVVRGATNVAVATP